MRRLALGVLATTGLVAFSAAPALASEEYGGQAGNAYQILAPGEEGGLAAGEDSTNQGILYDKLTPLRGNVTAKDLKKYYLSENFAPTGPIERTETPIAGLKIERDSNDVPDIIGETRAEAMYGSGWVAAKDRGLLLRLGLGPAFAAALSVPGINAFGLLLEARSFTPSAQAISYVEGQTASLEEQGAAGKQVIKDLENWAEGVNGYEATLPEAERLPHVTLADAIAGFAFIGSIFGNGGGQEVADSEFLSRLEAEQGETAGKEIFKDLREVNDPEAPTTGEQEFPYDGEPTGETPGALQVEQGSGSPSELTAAKAEKASRRKASNFLLVGSQDSASGHPIAVMGPQLGYYYPEIVMEGQLHAPGLDAQGVIAPISPYVFIGRGRDFAWSLTSEGAENNEQFLDKLCNPEGGAVTRETDSYEYDGQCVPFNTFDAGYLGETRSEPGHEVYFKESAQGPISGTVKVKGELYAVANARTTRGREPAGEVAFSMLDSDEVHGPQQFFNAANHLETTFNMAYVDSKHIAFFSTGRLPKNAPGTNPSLPTLGNGEYEWRGFLDEEEHPHQIDPSSGTLLNWNGKPAPGWGAASSEFSFGPLQRVQMFNGFKTGMTEASDASIMNKAATEDFPAEYDWSYIARVLAAGTAPSKLAEEAVAEVTKWAGEGGSLLGQNRPKAPAAAVMDKVFEPIAEAVLRPVLGDEALNEFKSIAGPIDNLPNSGGSSFDPGWYGYVYKDLKSLLGEHVDQPYSRQYCGNGSLSACSASLWAVIQKSVEELSAQFKSTDVEKWKAPKVRITFPPGILPSYTMRWTNRSTYQQVIEFTGHDEEE